MSSFPCLVRSVSGVGEVRYWLGNRLVDRYLEFVAGRARPNKLRAVVEVAAEKNSSLVMPVRPEPGPDPQHRHLTRRRPTGRAGHGHRRSLVTPTPKTSPGSRTAQRSGGHSRAE